MLTPTAYGDSRRTLWLRVREYAVPPAMIETATARRTAGDWAGACAAAGVDVDLDLRSLARSHGPEIAARIRADLRHLAPDLLRWHLPRVAPDGLLRPGLTVTLARYEAAGRDDEQPLHLVARTPPAWADAGQRIGLALWDGSRRAAGDPRHPHPRPDPRFRLDLHRHLWDARRTAELRVRSGADRTPGGGLAVADPDLPTRLPPGRGCAVDRWAAEAEILLRAEGRPLGPVSVRLGARHRLVLDLAADGYVDRDREGDWDRDGDAAGTPGPRVSAASGRRPARPLPVLPDAATWVLPDLDLLRTGAIEPGRLHPLVAAALEPDRAPAPTPPLVDRAGGPRLVDCRGARHRIGLVDGVLVPLDHDPAEIHREELLAALTGTPLPCLQVIDVAHRQPECLSGVRERLDHGDTAGALAVVTGLLGPDALLRGGALRDELAAAVERRADHRLYRAGLDLPARRGPRPDRLPRRTRRSGPRRTAPG
ncbi:hypothetical protein [Streptomyces sp. CB03911]|uniref:hypothetical protein n=1 Tax=Streptomyces sp. CB03911 TaxID=1804758 RepID=UPI00093A7890|nr:hypothetical protein [Streptomyces sp. CB03911]OKI17420.1 hypothetical protein A6A07_40165 [Streptomyces sp. CB03911]